MKNNNNNYDKWSKFIKFVEWYMSMGGMPLDEKQIERTLTKF